MFRIRQCISYTHYTTVSFRPLGKKIFSHDAMINFMEMKAREIVNAFDTNML
jgi:hypothetical protein